MNADLMARQQALVAALSQRDFDVSGLRALPGVEGGVERGLQAYRLNAQALSAKALSSVFPRLREALGEQDFDAMAWAFWRWAPPGQGDLALWGGRLTDFLSAQDGMEAELPDLARLEWAMHEAERAADDELDVASLDLLSTHAPSEVGLGMRAGVALLEQQAAGPMLVWRQAWRACYQPLAEGEAAFMRELLAGRDLAAALDAAAEFEFDFPVWLQTALREPWLQAARIITNQDEGRES